MSRYNYVDYAVNSETVTQIVTLSYSFSYKKLQ